MKHSESLKEIAPALTKAQAKIQSAIKDKTNPAFRSKYADLSSVIDAVKPALNEHGISFLQGFQDAADGVCVETMLLHISGEWISTAVTIPVVKHDAQGTGSAITYGKRYTLQSLCGVPSEDDDGNAAAAAAPVKNGTTRPAKHTVDDYSAPNGMPENSILKVIRTVKEVTEWLSQGSADDAVLAKENAFLDADETVFFWTFFDSKQRSAMKVAHEALIKRYNKQPETV